MIKTEFSFGEEITVTGEIVRIKAGQTHKWNRQEHQPRPALFLNGIHLANGYTFPDGGTFVKHYDTPR